MAIFTTRLPTKTWEPILCRVPFPSDVDDHRELNATGPGEVYGGSVIDCDAYFESPLHVYR